MAEQAGQTGRHHHAQRCQQHRLPHHRLHRLPARAEAAIKHDEQQRNAAHVLGKVVIVQIYRNGAYIAEHNTQHDECQQGRHSNPDGDIVQQDTGQDYDYDEDEEKCCHCLDTVHEFNIQDCFSDLLLHHAIFLIRDSALLPRSSTISVAGT